MVKASKILPVLLLAVAFAPGPLTAAGDAPVQVPEKLTLEEALSYAWYNHPAMKQVQHAVASVHGARVQAGLWPRPEVGLTGMKKADFEKETGAFISQKFELGGKRSARVAAADAMAFMKEAEQFDRWLEIRSLIKESFAKIDYSRKTAAVFSRMADADAGNEKLTKGLNSAGKVSMQEVIDACKRAAQSKAIAEAAKVRLSFAERTVLYSAGIGASAKPVEIVCAETNHAAVPDVASYLEQALTNAPAVRTARAAKLVAQAKERLVRTERWPDLTLKADYMRLSMDGEQGNGAALMAGIDLPLWNRGQGDRIEAQELLSGAKAGEAAAVSVTGARIADLLSEYQRKAAEERTLRLEVLPFAEKKHALNENMYNSGRISGRENFKSLNELLEVIIKCAEARLMVEIAAIQLERLSPVVTQ